MTSDADTGTTTAAALLRGRRVLVAEDRTLIASRIAQVLKGAGCTVIGPVPTLAAGLSLVRQEHGASDAAILDIDLRGELVYPLAEALRSRGVPVLFLTGFGDAVISAPWQEVPRVEKPFETADLLQALAAILARDAAPPPAPAQLDRQPSAVIRRAWETIRHTRDLVTEGRYLVLNRRHRFTQPPG